MNRQSRPDTLSRVIDRQHGVLSREQAGKLGLPMSTLRYRTRREGPWQKILPGVYLTVSGHPTFDQLDMAALLYAGQASMITGLAALRRYGVWPPADGLVDVVVPVNSGVSSRSYVRIHRTSRYPSVEGYQGEIRMVMPPRAVVDAALGLGSLREARALVTAIIQNGRCSVVQLEDELGTSRLRYSARIREVLAEAKAGIRSPAEADLMDLIKRAELPEPLYNAVLCIDEVFLAQPDAWWPKAGVAAEVDSKEWHFSADDWANTMKRHDRMTAAGILVLHFTPRMIRTEPDLVVTRIRQALSAGKANPRIVAKQSRSS